MSSSPRFSDDPSPNQTGVGIGSLASGLVAFAGGGSSAGHAEAFTAWGELMGHRRLVPVAVSH